MDSQVPATIDIDDASINAAETCETIQSEKLQKPDAGQLSNEDFEKMVEGALEAVEGTLLFRVRVIEGGEEVHAAAAAFGLGDRKQFLLLTAPAGGGPLKVEPASSSGSPFARIAESYAGLMDVLKAAA